MQNIKKIIVLICSVSLLSGCATYRFNHGKAPYNKGYVASRDDYTIPEYTLGRDNTVPQKIHLAKIRFKRRRNVVEDYYKRMGFIQNHFNMVVWQPCIYLVKMVGGVFCLPGIAISDYRYNNNPQYKEKIDRREKKQDKAEEDRIAGLKAKVNIYVQKDLNKYEPLNTTPAEEVSTPLAPPAVIEPETPKIEEPKVEEPHPAPVISQKETKGFSAFIVVKPVKGFSPLKVTFSGTRSRSPYGRIVSYSWDFGDGDTSNKPNPTNTYLSGTYGSKYFTATLTVQDDKGNNGSATATIEVINK